MLASDFYASGKLLLTSEYFVLDGALALAAPTYHGQSLAIFSLPNSDKITWKSFDEKNQKWFEAEFSLKDFYIINSSNHEIATRLFQILQAAKNLNPAFSISVGCKIITTLTFPREWGLGTSSTLIYNIAKWAEVDPFALLEKTFGGSGYDIACAGAAQPILYQLENGKPIWQSCDFHPSFSDQLFFIYLGKKQNSREGIAHYRSIKKEASLIKEFSNLTKEMIECEDFISFEKIIDLHENLISKTLDLQKVKDLYFKDFWGSVKSLGAWGGDFVLATSNRPAAATQQYFYKKGFEVFLKYEDLIL